MKKINMFITGLCLTVLMAGCGWPEEMTQKVETTTKKLEGAKKEIQQKQNSFTKLEKTDEYVKVFKAYSEKEKWKNHFTDANKKLNKARSLYTNLIKLQKNNDKDEISNAKACIKKIDIEILNAKIIADKPAKRIGFIRKIKGDLPALVKKANDEFLEIQYIAKNLTIVATKAAKDYPKQIDNIHKKLAKFRASYESSSALIAMIKEQNNSSPNYAMLGDGIVNITKNLKFVQRENKRLRNKLTELYTSYSKLLVDMKVDNYVVIKRESWDNGLDHDNSPDHVYNRKTDPDTFKYIASVGNTDEAAHYGGGWGTKSLSVKIDNKKWNALRIDEKANWPRYDDEATYYITDWRNDYFQKYVIIKNGNKTDSGWVKVSEDTFFDYENALGMEILSKPLGEFEEDTLKQANPPGLSYVGNPKYGRWETTTVNGRQRRRWSFLETYAMYHLMFGGQRSYYYYNDWNNWNNNYRGRSPYYGSNAAKPRYGTSSAGTRSRFANTSYSKSGGFKRSSASVRSGRSNRGGGPSRGGK